ncbi:MAG: hypothetical protein COT73_04825 [Bdellovibrio sp. CG10_big_fil_rev_8_21_14_0_10_47_8]|nr:MAG: hypothetical protein COT73_04825 [Bdellovibrio sp. CG10_big_fil_rev_8_21_14_0_10_47_8]
MLEVTSILKTFVAAILITMALQVKLNNRTVENHVQDWYQASILPGLVQGVSSGAVLVIKDATHTVTQFVSKTFGHEGSSTRASHLNFELKRNLPPAKESSQHEDY